MDLTLPIIGLTGFLGYKLNSGSPKTPRTQTNVRTQVSPYSIPSGKNIYYSTYTDEIDSKTRKLIEERYTRSKKQFGVIPSLLETECKTGCGTADRPSEITPSVLAQYNPKISAKNTAEKFQNQALNGPLFKNKLTVGKGFSGSDMVSYSEAYAPFDGTSKLSGQPSILGHNSNVLPSYGSKMKQNMRNDASKRTLETFTGADSLYKTKIETVTSPFFAPAPMTNFGAPSMTELVGKDRYTTSNNKNDLLPVTQIKVAPIDPSLLRETYKSIDEEFRTANNPQTSLTETPVKGHSSSELTYGRIGEISKHRPERFFTEKNGFGRASGPNKPNYSGNYSQTGIKKSLNNGKQGVIAPASNPSAGTYIPTLNINDGKVCSQGNNPGTGNNPVPGFNSYTIPTTKEVINGDWSRGISSDRKESSYRPKHYIQDQERQETSRQVVGNAAGISFGEIVRDDTPIRPTIKEGNLFNFIPNGKSQVEGVLDYASDYSYTRDKNPVNTKLYTGNASMPDKRGMYTGEKFTPFNETRSQIQKSSGNIYGGQMNGKQSRTEIVACKTPILEHSPFGGVGQIWSPNEPPKSEVFCKSKTIKRNEIDPCLLTAFNSNPYTQKI